MRESRSSGSEGERGGNEPLYPENIKKIYEQGLTIYNFKSDCNKQQAIKILLFTLNMNRKRKVKKLIAIFVNVNHLKNSQQK